MLSKVKICACDDNDKPINSSMFYVQFNPGELSISEPCAQTEYGEGEQPREKQKNHVLTLSAELFFNTYTSASQKTFEDVRGYIRKFYPFTNSGGSKKNRLKKICFSWGTQCMVGILEKLDVTYTLFASDGTPLRAKASISIVGSYYGEPPKGLAVKKEEKLTETVSFMEALRGFKEPYEWKKEAKKQGIGKARTS